MFLNFSKFNVAQSSLVWGSCFLIGFIGFAAGLNTQNALGQSVQNRGGLILQQPVVQQPAIGQPTPVFQGQPIQRQPIQGQGIPGQIIQQPVPGVPSYQPGRPIYQGGVPSNGIQTLPPIVRTVPQAQDDNAKKALEAERAAYKAAKLEVEKLLEKNKALMAQNEGAIEQFESLKTENASLTKRMAELNQANDRVQATVVDLRKKLEAAGEADPAAMRESEQLKINYRESVNQIKDLETRVETLSTENENFRVKIADLTAAQKEAMKPNENDQTAQLTEKNQALTNANQTLTQQQQTLSQENETLVQQNDTLTKQNETLVDQNRVLGEQQQMTLGQNETLTTQVTELSASNEGFVSQIASLKARPPQTTTSQPTVNVAGFESKITQLTRENRELAKSSSAFEDENRALRRQLAKLEAQPATVTVDSSKGSLDVEAGIQDVAAVAAPVADAGFDFSKLGTLGWLIPFLVLGLGIAFFVIVREEIHRPPTGSGRKDQRN